VEVRDGPVREIVEGCRLQCVVDGMEKSEEDAAIG
jgi:hypothetical protein